MNPSASRTDEYCPDSAGLGANHATKAGMRILSITQNFQHPVVTGSHRNYHFIRELSKRHEIIVFTLATRPVPPEALTEMRSYATDIHVFDVSNGAASPFSAMVHRRGVVSRMNHALRRYIRDHDVDVVLFHGKKLSGLLDGLDVPLVIDFCDATSMRMMDQLCFEGLLQKPRRLGKYLIARRNERRLLRSSRQIAFISARDRAATIGADSESIVIPNGVDTDFWSPQCNSRERNTLALTGVMSYRPNEVAALLLMHRIMPRLRRGLDNPRLLLIGRAPTARMVSEAALLDDVTVTGAVDDVRPWMERAEIFVAPIQFASGMQNKVLEAMAMRLPVITTSIVAEGVRINGPEDVPVIVADDEAAFAEAVMRLLNDPAERERLGNAGRQYVQRHFSWSESALKLETLCRDAIAAVTGR